MLHDDDHRALGHRLGLFHFQEEAAGMSSAPARLTPPRPRGSPPGIVLRQGYREVQRPQVPGRPVWEGSGHVEHLRRDARRRGRGPGAEAVRVSGHMELVRRLGPLWSEPPLRVAEFASSTATSRRERCAACSGSVNSRGTTGTSSRRDQFGTASPLRREPAGAVRTARLRGARGHLLGASLDRLGDDAVWDRAEALLADAARAAGLSWSHRAGEAAFLRAEAGVRPRDPLGRAWHAGRSRSTWRARACEQAPRWRRWPAP